MAALAPLQLSHVSRPPGSLERLTHTHRDPRTASTYSDTHTHTETHTHTDIDAHTQRPTHCLNSLDLTLHTEHLTDNSHSDFLRDEKCFRATRRLVLETRTLFWCILDSTLLSVVYAGINISLQSAIVRTKIEEF